jgi:phage baseplate assembly protein W
MPRRDYSYPFRLDPASGQARQASYGAHVEQMIRQVLLTAPGERIDLPEFGCGLRQLLFAPNSEALQASARLIVQRALTEWLATHVQLVSVSVLDGNGDGSRVDVQIEYVLIETQSKRTTTISMT